MIYFTSDLHFGHTNIIKYCNRPFAGVDHMNGVLAANYNSVVGVDDTCYIIGDFAMGPKVNHPTYVSKLNGRKILVRGNHDAEEKKMLAMGFDEVHDRLTIDIEGQKVYMSHIPPKEIDPYEDRFYFLEYIQPPPEHDIWLCGHVHNAWVRKGKVINVGVDVRGYKPVTFQELIEE